MKARAASWRARWRSALPKTARVLGNASVGEAVQFLRALEPQAGIQRDPGRDARLRRATARRGAGRPRRPMDLGLEPEPCCERDRTSRRGRPRSRARYPRYQAEADDLRSLMAYPPGSAGALMDTRTVVTYCPETARERGGAQSWRSLREQRIPGWADYLDKLRSGS